MNSVSKLWSCDTLDAGVAHVVADSFPDELEAELLKQLQETIINTYHKNDQCCFLMNYGVLLWGDSGVKL